MTKALYYNVQRLGVSNCIVVNYDGRKIPETMKGFDKVLLDAPCTGLGVISRDPSIKSSRTLLDVKKAAHLQRELLRAAIDVCKVGGTIVYSTCSIAAEENEGVIDFILRKRYVKVVETGLPIDKEGLTKYEDKRYDQRVRLTRRVYPHMHNMDGFFIAKLIKTKDGPREVEGIANEKAIKEQKEQKKAKGQTARKELEGAQGIVHEEEEEPSTAAEERLVRVPGEKKKISKKMLGKRDRLRLKGKLKGNHPPGTKHSTQIPEEPDVDQQNEKPQVAMLAKRKPEVEKHKMPQKPEVEKHKMPQKPAKEAPKKDIEAPKKGKEAPKKSQEEQEEEAQSEKKALLLKRIQLLKKQKAQQ